MAKRSPGHKRTGRNLATKHQQKYTHLQTCTPIYDMIIYYTYTYTSAYIVTFQ